MVNGKSINIDECHNILITLASAFDEICRRHHIPYYMLGGTMLGAVRHRGFIPWDDDMDFGVERSYFPQLIKALSEELPEHLKVRTLDNSNHIFSNFCKIEDTRTEVIENWHDNSKGIGICIDVFPLDKGRKKSWQTKIFASYIYTLLQLKDYVYFDPKFRRGFKKYVAIILRKTNRISIKKRLQIIEELIRKHTHKESPYLINYYGRWRKKEITTKSIIGQPQAYPFENIILTGVENANTYLSTLYGNYKQLPPEEKRINHINSMCYK